MRSRDITRLRADSWLKTPDDDVSMPKAPRQKKVLLVLDVSHGSRIYFFQQ